MGAERRIILCADDYGIAPGVNAAICDLVARRRLNATSVMVVGPALDAAAIDALAKAAEGTAQIGLHFTLTGPFNPVTDRFRPLERGRFRSIGRMLALALARRLDPDQLAAEAHAQLAVFAERFGRPPDYVDGHQHVHLLPQVRDAVLAAMTTLAPNAWARQCGRVSRGFRDPKGLLIDRLSVRFRRAATAQGIATNPAFSGTYRFEPTADFSVLFPGFLDRLPDCSVVMCHPGHVDEVLRLVDPLTDLREREYAYLASDRLPQDLASAGVALL